MIIGDVVGLRAIEPEDLDLLAAWRNTPGLRQYFREYRELTSRDQEAWYQRSTSDPGTLMLAIVDRTADTLPLVGATGLCYIDWVQRSAELSLYIGRDELYVDDRLAPDALRVLVEYAFEELALHRLWTEVYSFDERKARLYENFGFRLEGQHRDSHFAKGGWHDSLFFSLLEGEQPDRR